MAITVENRQSISSEARARHFVEHSLGTNIQRAADLVIKGINSEIENMENKGLTHRTSRNWNIQREDRADLIFYHFGSRNLETTIFRNHYKTYVDHAGQSIKQMLYQEKCYLIAAQTMQQLLSENFSQNETYTIETRMKLQGCFAGRFRRLPYTLISLAIPIVGWAFLGCDSGLFSGKIQFTFHITRKDAAPFII